MKFYQSGEPVPYSGVYRVIHRDHMHSHEVTCLSGEPFPECVACKNHVRFVLLSPARSIKKHASFRTEGAASGPGPSGTSPSRDAA